MTSTLSPQPGMPATPPATLRRPVTHRLLNLTFHGLADPPASLPDSEKRYWLPIPAFDRFLDQAALSPDVQVTFDDGFLSDATIALPRLQQRSLHATFFILAARIGTPGYLALEDIRTLLAAGMSIGSHGMNHRPWRRLSPEDLHQEISAAKARLEDLLGISITQAACPFGAYDRAALRALKRAGFSRVYTSDRGFAHSSAWLQPRNTITASTPLDHLDRVRAWPRPRQWAHQLKLALKRCR